MGNPMSETKVSAKYNLPNCTSPRKRPYAMVNTNVEAQVIACPKRETTVLPTIRRSTFMKMALWLSSASPEMERPPERAGEITECREWVAPIEDGEHSLAHQRVQIRARRGHPCAYFLQSGRQVGNEPDPVCPIAWLERNGVLS